MIHYCPHCGNRIAYEAIKPKSCTKCKRDFVDAFATTVHKPTTIVYVTRAVGPATEVVDDEDDKPISKSRAQILARAKRKAARVEYRDEEGNLIDATEGANDEDDGEVVNPREVRRRARELAASIRGGIKVQDNDEKTVRFGDWCGQPSNPNS